MLEKNKNETLRQMVINFLITQLVEPSEWDLMTLADSLIDSICVYQEHFFPNAKLNFEISDGIRTLKIHIKICDDGRLCSSVNITSDS